MQRILSSRLYLVLACVGLIVLLGFYLVVQNSLSAHADEPCAQFIRHQHPSSPIVDQLARWRREQLDPISIEAEHQTPYGVLQLYRVNCPLGMGTFILNGFRLGAGVPGNTRTALLEDIGPNVPRPGTQAIQFLSSKIEQLQDGRIVRSVLGQINDPVVQYVEVTLDTGAIIRAETSEHIFVVLIENQHEACEIRALDAQRRVLDHIKGDGVTC